MTRIYEWIHTSAPQTLEGSGYGVVARSRDIPAALEKFLRGRSRYDFLKPDLPEKGFPVYAHVLFRDGRTEWHVLSRMLPCGIDYTGREVFIAHHIAIPVEQFAGQSVVRWLLRSDLFRDAWTAPPQLLEPREVPADVRVPLPHGEWHNSSRGQAEPDCLKLFRHSRKPPLFLLADSGEGNFHLLCEALLELPPAEHNRISFVSATLSAHQDVQYDWIGLVRGTSFCEEQLRTAPQRVLDLLDPRRLAELQRAPQPAAAPPAPPHAARSGSPLFSDTSASDIPWREDPWKPRSSITPASAPMTPHLPPVPTAPAAPPASGRMSVILLSLLLLLAVAAGTTLGLRLQGKVKDLSEQLAAAEQKVDQQKLTEQDLNEQLKNATKSSAQVREKSQEDIGKLNSEKTKTDEEKTQRQQELNLVKKERDDLQAAAKASAETLTNQKQAESALQAEIRETSELQTAAPESAEYPISGISDDLEQFQEPGTHTLATLPDDFPKGPELSLELLGNSFTGLETKAVAAGPSKGLDISDRAKDSNPGLRLVVSGSELQLVIPEAAAATTPGRLKRLRCCCLRIRSGEQRMLVTMNRQIAPIAVYGTGTDARKERDQLSETLQKLETTLQPFSGQPGRMWTLEWRLGGISADRMLPELKGRSGVLWVSWQRSELPPLEYPLAFWKPEAANPKPPKE
ncbi:MAG: hypothetical protein ACKOEO_19860 [Planctomycetaceae bacterium]